MTKPHEETWCAELHGNACECSSRVCLEGAAGDDAALFFSNDGGRAYAQHGRLRLAAAAPEMARLLLELEWVTDSNSNGPREEWCPWCDHRRGYTPLPEESLDREHLSGCLWLAVMRKAGVIE